MIVKLFIDGALCEPMKIQVPEINMSVNLPNQKSIQIVIDSVLCFFTNGSLVVK